MTRGKNQHVVKHPDGWAVKGAGNSKATKVTDTQKEAIERAEQIARNQHPIPKSMAVTPKSEPETAMATTHIHRKIRNKHKEHKNDE